MDIVEKAKQYAIKAHSDTNHMYDDKPYSYHLQQVFDIAERNIHLITNVRIRNIILAACWLHDTIEDTRKTYNDIKQEFGVEIADLVYALTNEKGKSRKERENDKYFAGIANEEGAIFVKLCDRIANVAHSLITRSSMFRQYGEEHSMFVEYLYEERYKSLFDSLEGLLITVI